MNNQDNPGQSLEFKLCEASQPPHTGDLACAATRTTALGQDASTSGSLQASLAMALAPQQS